MQCMDFFSPFSLSYLYCVFLIRAFFSHSPNLKSMHTVFLTCTSCVQRTTCICDYLFVCRVLIRFKNVCVSCFYQTSSNYIHQRAHTTFALYILYEFNYVLNMCETRYAHDDDDDEEWLAYFRFLVRSQLPQPKEEEEDKPCEEPDTHAMRESATSISERKKEKKEEKEAIIHWSGTHP